MSSPRKLVIAARQSDLARLQAYRVGTELKRIFSDLEIEYAFRASLGDKNLEDPLWKMPEKGVFTEDFLGDLIDGRADLVVHSWKDLPTEKRTETAIVATLPRADSRDLLLVRRDRFTAIRSSRKIKILTSSPRRAYNLAPFLKDHLPFDSVDVVFENVRGNIPTRLRKMLELDVDGLVVAKAALDRLLEAPEPEFANVQAVIKEALARAAWMVLPLSANPTAAAQGALAVEIRRDRSDLGAMLSRIHCAATFSAVTHEREVLASYGGGCHQKIGVSVLERAYGNLMYLRGLTDAGEVLNVKKLDSAANPKSEAKADYFPRSGEEASFFERETLPAGDWAWAQDESCLWVARESAVPGDFRFRDDTVVWTAGLETWRKLARRGVWVSGTADGLGEREPARVDALLGKPASWVKLTHDRAAKASVYGSSMAKVCATYRLKNRASVPDLSKRTHFFWMSSSAFERALELFPSIARAQHATGPGLTNDFVRARLPGAKVAVFLSVDDYRRSLGEK